MKNLGEILSRVFSVDASMEMQLDDVHAFGGCSDCVSAVVGYLNKKAGAEIKRIEQEIGRTWEEIEAEAENRLEGRWSCFTILQQEVVGRILARKMRQ